jgi:predicted nucleic acid-binding protein
MRAHLLDVPCLASEICGVAYRKYLDKRKAQSGKDGPKTPLADFFIGAHAELMGWELVTGDKGRFETYFPSVKLITPPEHLPEPTR